MAGQQNLHQHLCTAALPVCMWGAHALANLQPPAVYRKPILVCTLPSVCSLRVHSCALACMLHLPSTLWKRTFAVQLSLVHACRFVCRQKLGFHADAGAEYVTPLPENAVVYGSGDKAIVLTRVSIACLAARLAPHS